jgi:D-alanine transfer protein
MLWKKLRLHFLSFLAALFLCSLMLLSLYLSRGTSSISAKIISGKQQTHRGVYYNLLGSENDELEFMASLKNPNQLTIFGSSELSSSPYCSHNFLPDSMGIPAVAFGHAFHQSFSILCELLAGYEFLKNSKICIVISPSWFSTSGTNTEAFTEFVRPNFLKIIACNSAIDLKYKIAIGNFIEHHRDEFSVMTNTMNYYCDMYHRSSRFNSEFVSAHIRLLMQKIHACNFEIENVVYDPIISQPNYSESKKFTPDYLKMMQQDFLSKITNNNIYVNDEYYQQYLLSDSGTTRRDSISIVDLKSNQEMEDFKLVVDLLAEQNANCSFIIQPVNPYYYEHAERYQPLVDSLTNLLDSKNFPYLNLYVNDKKDYEPGILNDVMHLGDYGWMKINIFLDSIYDEH